MLTDDECQALFSRVMDRMVRAGWLDRYTFTDGKGFHLVWTESGAIRALELGEIIREVGLADEHDYRAAIAFSVLAQRSRLLAGSAEADDIPLPVAETWCRAVDELGMADDADGLFGLVHVIRGWEPGSGTNVVFG